jgi:hypothetical protein
VEGFGPWNFFSCPQRSVVCRLHSLTSGDAAHLLYVLHTAVTGSRLRIQPLGKPLRWKRPSTLQNNVDSG